jgi:antitoxin component of MazEF toxin-antitoxin module
MAEKKQKIIKAGNSLAITIPAEFVREGNLAVGDELIIETTPQYGMMLIKKPEFKDKAHLTPEFKNWLDDFTTKNSILLKKLAKTPGSNDIS